MTRLLGVKLRRDLAAVRGRIVLMGVAIGVSLVVFGAVLFAGAVVDREFDRSYLDTDPASATLVLADGLDVERAGRLAVDVATGPGVTAATMRTQLTGQVAVHGRWSDKPLQLFVAAPGDPLRPARFDVEQGSWPPPADGILIERAALALLGLAVGDRVVVQSPDGPPATLTVTGVAHDPSLADARQEQKGYGFISTATVALLGRPAVLNELKITTVDSGDRTKVVGVARAVADRVGARGVAVEEIQVPEPGQQPHRRWVDLILTVLFAFGGTSLLLSGVLAATMLNRLLGGQIPQIGIMKAIGGRTAPIVALHLSATLAVSATATAVAVAPALLLGRSLAGTLLAMYDMDATSTAVPWWTSGALVAAGVLLAPLMALVPVLRASRTTVRQAMDHHGTRAAPAAERTGTGELGRSMARIRGLGPAVTMGLRNAGRRRTRFGLLVSLLAVAGGLFVGGSSTLAGLSAFQEQAVAQQRWDAEVDLGGLTTAAAAAGPVSALRDVAGVETWTVLPTTVARDDGQIEVTGTYPDQGHGILMLAAVPPATSILQVPLVAGRWLQPDDTDAVVLDVGTQDGLVPGARIGDRVSLRVDGRITGWGVVGLVSQRFAGSSAFVTTDGFAAATGRVGQANRVEITTARHDPPTQAAVADRARQSLADAGIDVRTAMPIARLGTVVDGHVYAAGYVLLVIAVVLAVVGCIGMASALSTAVLERTREFGVMHAIGAPPGAVRRIVVAEGLITGLTGILLGMPVAAAVTAALNLVVGRMIGGGDALPLRFSLPAVLVWVGVVLAGSVLATLPPARRAVRLTVREALAQL